MNSEDSWILRFNSEVLPVLNEKFKPVKIILFGSRISGNSHENSDIDAIIVSEIFKEISFVNRMSTVLKEISFPKHIDFICYTPDEFLRIRNTSSVIQDAMENCLEVAA